MERAGVHGSTRSGKCLFDGAAAWYEAIAMSKVTDFVTVWQLPDARVAVVEPKQRKGLRAGRPRMQDNARVESDPAATSTKAAPTTTRN